MANLEINVNEDGTIEPDVEGISIERYYQPCEYIYLDKVNGFIGVVSCFDGGDAETRIQLETIDGLKDELMARWSESE